jgi:hypothetical protein
MFLEVYTLIYSVAALVDWCVARYCCRRSWLGEASRLLHSTEPPENAQVAVRGADCLDRHVLFGALVRRMFFTALWI